MASNGFYILANDPGDSYTDSPFTYTINTSGTMTGVTYSFGWEFTCDGVTTKETVASGLTSSTYRWAPTSVKFGPLMKKSQSGTLTIVVKTVNGRDVRYTRDFTLKLKESVKPAVSSISIARTDPFNNRSVSNITTHKLSFNVAGLYGASQTVTVTIGDAKYTKEVAAVSGASATAVSFDIGSFDAGSSATLAKSIAISVTDARGRTGTASTSVTIYKYTPPAITKATVERNASERPVLTFTYSYQATVAGATNTLKQFWARCVVGSNTYQTDLKDKTSPQVLTGTYDISKSYTFLVLIQDSVRPSAIIAKPVLPSTKLVMDIGADGKTVTFFGSSPSSATKESLQIGNMASFAGDEIAIGKNSTSSVIDLCNGTGTIGNVNPSGGYKRLEIKSQDSVEITTGHLIKLGFPSERYNAPSITMMSDRIPWEQGSVPLEMLSLKVGGEPEIWSGIDINNISASMYSVVKTESGGFETGGYVMTGGSDVEVSNLISEGTIIVNSGAIVLPNDKTLRGKDTTGVTRALAGINSNNDIIYGYGTYDIRDRYTYLYGGKGIIFRTKNPEAQWSPYICAGMSINIPIGTSGFITNSGKDVYFTVPIGVPIVGDPTISVSSVNGLQVRQNNKYLYGSSATGWAKPSSYIASVVNTKSGIQVIAKMPNATNVINNSACGIYASIKITFS